MLTRYRGYLVHAYTASTLLFVTLAMTLILNGNYRGALAMLTLTIVIDATDGALARKYRVKETAATIDGELLDNLVDFLSYVAVPMLFVLHAELVLEPAWLVLTFVMFSSAFGFSRTTAKLSDEGFFVGFPSYWNIVVFYLFLLETTPTFNTALLIALSGLVFVPIRFLYVSRMPRARALHIVLGALWSVLCLLALLLPAGDVRQLLLQTSLIYPIYYAVHSVLLDLQTRP